MTLRTARTGTGARLRPAARSAPPGRVALAWSWRHPYDRMVQFGRRKPTREPFGAALLSVRGQTERRIEAHPGIGQPNRVVLLSSSAGAAVALGGYGTFLIDEFASKSLTIPTPAGELDPHRIVEFARALRSTAGAIEAAYRVLTWAYTSEFAVFFWRPNYELELRGCAEVFEFRNVYEGEIPALGAPRAPDASVEELADRAFDLVKGSLVCMIAAAIDEPIDWDDPLVSMHLASWDEQFGEGLDVARERMAQLAPNGLPIWEA